MITYIATLVETDISVKLVYDASGNFKRLEQYRKRITSDIMPRIGRIIPTHIDKLEKYKNLNQGRVIYEQVLKEKSLYTKFNDLWFYYHQQHKGFKPKFTAVDGKKLKSIIAYLQELEGNDASAIALWEVILQGYKSLEFHRKIMDLKYIESKLNVIISALKQNEQSSNIQTADDLVNQYYQPSK